MPPEAQIILLDPLAPIKTGLDTFSVAIQQPGDLILTHMESSHKGYNTGNNLAIAVNWASKDWLFHCLSQHTEPVSHDIIYNCQCAGVSVGIPLDIWSSKIFNPYSLEIFTTWEPEQFSTAATTWCFYIFLGLEYSHHSTSIEWL